MSLSVQVTELYSTSSWQHINEHLHEVLGRQCAELADGPGAGPAWSGDLQAPGPRPQHCFWRYATGFWV